MAAGSRGSRAARQTRVPFTCWTGKSLEPNQNESPQETPSKKVTHRILRGRPDSMQFAFLSHGDNPEDQIYVFSVENSEPKQISNLDGHVKICVGPRTGGGPYKSCFHSYGQSVGKPIIPGQS